MDLDIQGQRIKMNFREIYEKKEQQNLNFYAAKSINSKGRMVKEEKCDFRSEYRRDRDRILHSKAFRRLMHKTQVFLSPEGDHYRTRLTHTLEVSQVARTIAGILNLNEDLTEAISLGHDLGHTPFGHNGEDILNKIHKFGFRHNEQSLRTVDLIEMRGEKRGLNLTFEVRDGILNHRGNVKPATLEGQIVKISDRIAYINHDIDDAIRSKIITENDLPKYEIEILGKSHSERINNLIADIVYNSENKDEIKQSKDFQEALNSLRQFMFNNVYKSEDLKRIENLNKVNTLIETLYNHFIKSENKLPEIYEKIKDEEGIDIAVKDYVAGMTDRYALACYLELVVPQGLR